MTSLFKVSFITLFCVIFIARKERTPSSARKKKSVLHEVLYDKSQVGFHLKYTFTIVSLKSLYCDNKYL